ncbi:hypothetical protein D8S78_12600 [Natrialba swarupiae]|nr:hypothetical protein [Natrialba swarupiae]
MSRFRCDCVLPQYGHAGLTAGHAGGDGQRLQRRELSNVLQKDATIVPESIYGDLSEDHRP